MDHGEIMVKCCKCHRVRLEGEWVRERRDDPVGRRYSHSYCPSCLVKVHADMEVLELFARV